MAQGLRAEHKLTLPILRDEGNAVADAYGLRHRLPDDLAELYGSFGIDLNASNGESSQTLPLPARYVIGQDGVVRYAAVHGDYKLRPEPLDTLDALRASS